MVDHKGDSAVQDHIADKDWTTMDPDKLVRGFGFHAGTPEQAAAVCWNLMSICRGPEQSSVRIRYINALRKPESGDLS